MSEKMHWIRLVYIYLFSIIGLVLVVISSVRMLDMGLKATLFKKAEADSRQFYPAMPVPYEKQTAEAVISCAEKCGFSEEEKQQARDFLADYNKQQDQEIPYYIQERYRTSAISIAMIVVGLPLYLYHWRLARKAA
ncbi:MAG: hypothetical protein A3H59_01005 [Candidatus Jacksonbacteria bacterium RIFCSPLOWO2_02_FULL_43_9]|nr:MAG: hypothetical protein A3B94_02255 [Candidatus Jacksonbacteria bacterium RIFCSPHIGHO2_02_FULL_43_10]OGY70367.1 MAG: hypothetical protein A2986_00220 [Candidatus Jacksonbacteria bacterium RIFCSPLOWO2_01_FULL_44_13]OGY73800.1 MAG: hypothetical protein A3H59_01005 [Candidatus Jacksonbacteria bacterium RIFCSPLOWO2_02_FULL_43_9]HAZ16559.1 hypothetical protein [Candidatus Jacksonbacteria bacterium]